MANVNSDVIASLDGGTALRHGGSNSSIYTCQATVAVTGSQFNADGDTVTLVRIPSNARIVSIKLFNDDLDSGTNTAPNLGLYHKDGTLIVEDCYASAIADLQTANVVGKELAFEARDINKINNFVWEDAGLASDPQKQVDLVLTQTASVGGAQAGDISVHVIYTV